jgi:hypothetical protein
VRSRLAVTNRAGMAVHLLVAVPRTALCPAARTDHITLQHDETRCSKHTRMPLTSCFR